MKKKNKLSVKKTKPLSKRKGRRASETQTYNHPRKDFHA